MEIGNHMAFIVNVLLFFSFYAFGGWVVEVVFRSANRGRFVNAGFLYGPFLPIYGFGTVAVIGFHTLFPDSNIILQTLAYGLAISVTEYLTGTISEKMFGFTLWDYHDNRLNLKGRICLKYSLLWTGAALLLVMFIHPFVERTFSFIDERHRVWVATLGAAYFLVDATVSVIAVTSFKKRVLYLRSQYLFIDNEKIQNIFVSFRRLLDAFPRLHGYLHGQITGGIKSRAESLLTMFEETPRKTREEERANDAEYLRIVADIEQNEDFLRLRDFKHHDDTILNHVEAVSYLAYRICKRLRLDFRSAARGGLLHDFFLYDWRNHDAPDLPREKYHGFEHPKIAMENAERHFKLNEIERDIILKHMWPLTLVPPRYKESFIVTFVDKYVSSREFLKGMRSNGKPNEKRNY